jgi:tetratricopeptide (TPR) repeat protein
MGLAMESNDMGRAFALAQERKALCTVANDKRGCIATLRDIAFLYTTAQYDNFASAIATLKQALAVANELAEPDEIASMLSELGAFYINHEDYEQAGPWLERSLTLRRQINLDWDILNGTYVDLLNLGVIAMKKGDAARAVQRCEEGLRLCREVGDTTMAAWALIHLSRARRTLQDFDGALGCMKEALAMLYHMCDTACIPYAMSDMSMLARQCGDRIRAVTLAGFASKVDLDRLYFLKDENSALAATLSAARAELIFPALAAAWAEGEQMTLEQVVQYALAGNSQGFDTSTGAGHVTAVAR